jgi:hypothetical protein
MPTKRQAFLPPEPSSAARRSRNQMVTRWRSDTSPGGAWPPSSPRGEGGLISHLLPGEKVLRYEADEGFLGSTPRLSTRAPKCLLKKQESTTLQCRGTRILRSSAAFPFFPEEVGCGVGVPPAVVWESCPRPRGSGTLPLRESRGTACRPLCAHCRRTRKRTGLGVRRIPLTEAVEAVN